jgi:hypothetical protein
VVLGRHQRVSIPFARAVAPRENLVDIWAGLIDYINEKAKKKT